VTVYKVIVDKRPIQCMFCPINSSGIKITHADCGKRITAEIEKGWQSTFNTPDERCLLEEGIR
jgi:hypothetical protein